MNTHEGKWLKQSFRSIMKSAHCGQSKRCVQRVATIQALLDVTLYKLGSFHVN